MAKKKKKAKHTRPQAMQRPEPVPPVNVDVRVVKRTSHGIRCECGSLDVRVHRVETRTHPPHLNQRTQTKKRSCVCQVCGRKWPYRVRITEERL